MYNTISNIMVFGASITDSPWYTWKDFLEIESKLPVTNMATKGSGNEFMINLMCKHIKKINTNTLVIIMFTNIDKFDWYVEGNLFKELKNEKHPPKAISNKSGFWCTGSWFPKQKSKFYDLYYSQDYFCAKTIQQIILFRQICELAGAQYLILFDSPIWNFTEQEINNLCGKTPTTKEYQQNFLDLPLSASWKNLLVNNEKQIQNINLLGYCWNKNLEWYNTNVKSHPPSSSHWLYYQEIIKPKLHKVLKLEDCDLKEKIQKMDDKWKKY